MPLKFEEVLVYVSQSILVWIAPAGRMHTQVRSYPNSLEVWLPVILLYS